MKSLLMAALFILCSQLVHAQEKTPLKHLISGLSAITDSNCLRLQRNLDRAKADGTFLESMEQAYDNLCVCVPAQLQAFRSSLSAAELQSALSAEEFQSLLLEPVIGKCAAEQVRATYTGNACVKRSESKVPDSDAYCECMSAKLGALPHRELVDIGIAAADYVPLAAEARKNGLPRPEAPPVMKNFLEIERACSGDGSDSFSR